MRLSKVSLADLRATTHITIKRCSNPELGYYVSVITYRRTTWISYLSDTKGNSKVYATSDKAKKSVRRLNKTAIITVQNDNA